MLFSNNLMIEYGVGNHAGFTIQHDFPITYTAYGIVVALASYHGVEAGYISTVLYPTNTTLEYFCIAIRGGNGASVDIPFQWISVGY